MLRISNIKISVTVNNDEIIRKLKEKAAKTLKVLPSKIKKLEISKKSIDARDRKNILFVFSVDVMVDGENKYLNNQTIKNVSKVKEFEFSVPKINTSNAYRPIVVGFGPAGFMAGLILAKAGLKPIIIEQGKPVEQRMEDVEAFRKDGKFNPVSNIQFGEGGAGTFSDGKLTTGTNSPLANVVISEFIENGAPEEIKYNAKPHIGTDNLVEVVRNIRKKIISLGGEVLFNKKLVDITIKNGSVRTAVIYDLDENKTVERETDTIILAVGHSSRDTFKMLKEKNIDIEQKAFSVGVRIEHSQKFIDNAVYGEFSKYLSAADYKLHRRLQNGRNVYTFCMCPGGVVVNAASEENSLVTNGMSYFSRDGRNANSAVLIGITPDDFGSDDPLAGIEYQRRIEKNAYIIGGENYNAPVQKVSDFLDGIETTEIGEIIPTILPGYKCCNFKDIFSSEIYDSLRMGIKELDKIFHGFANPDAVITAPETRSSSPVRITRNSEFNCIAVRGVIPCGEGCGYAGGIMSAAVDGIKCALSVIEKY